MMTCADDVERRREEENGGRTRADARSYWKNMSAADWIKVMGESVGGGVGWKRVVLQPRIRLIGVAFFELEKKNLLCSSFFLVKFSFLRKKKKVNK